MSDEVFIKQEITLPISGGKAVVKTVDGMVYLSMLGNKKAEESAYNYLSIVTDSINGVGNVTAKMIKDLLVPDQEAIAIHQYIINYGDFDFGFVCPYCEVPDDHCVDLETLDLLPIHPDSSGAPDPVICLVLPATQRKVEVGMLTGHKELILNKLRNNTGTFDINQSDFQCLRTLDGSTNFTYQDVVKLPAKDHKAIRLARKKLIGGYDVNITVPCGSCGKRTKMSILAHGDFWVPGGSV